MGKIEHRDTKTQRKYFRVGKECREINIDMSPCALSSLKRKKEKTLCLCASVFNYKRDYKIRL